ncbi:hypothetical protein M5D96_011966 [Drosophila gunungcola]|uniref:Uncharacterized protein n=1 Tax=Drosophila gunungcola TaxID=103775 RepID=A0A9P9YDY7_9MUSC|nr:hypothetical protein M5D96_011966 [Drosophila gunungcola]
MLFFSATYDKEVMDFARLIVADPTIIRNTKIKGFRVNTVDIYLHFINRLPPALDISRYRGLTLGIEKT